MNFDIIWAIALTTLILVSVVITSSAVDDSLNPDRWWWEHARKWAVEAIGSLHELPIESTRRDFLNSLDADDRRRWKKLVPSLDRRPLRYEENAHEVARSMNAVASLTLPTAAYEEIRGADEDNERESRRIFQGEIANHYPRTATDVIRLLEHVSRWHPFAARFFPAWRPNVYRAAIRVLLDYVGYGVSAALVFVAVTSVLLGVTDALSDRVGASALAGAAFGLLSYFSRVIRYLWSFRRPFAVGFGFLTCFSGLVLLAPLLQSLE